MSTVTPIITPQVNPWANSRTDNVTPAANASTPDDIANIQTGFPTSQASPLSTPGATPVKEAEMNGMLNYYTNYLCLQGQGHQYTFNADVSTKIGGYSQGAVLWSAVAKAFQVSLKNNNTANFVTNVAYINDGINWATIQPAIATEASDGLMTIATAVELSGTSPRPEAAITASQAQNNTVAFKQLAVTSNVSAASMVTGTLSSTSINNTNEILAGTMRATLYRKFDGTALFNTKVGTVAAGTFSGFCVWDETAGLYNVILWGATAPTATAETSGSATMTFTFTDLHITGQSPTLGSAIVSGYRNSSIAISSLHPITSSALAETDQSGNLNVGYTFTSDVAVFVRVHFSIHLLCATI